MLLNKMKVKIISSRDDIIRSTSAQTSVLYSVLLLLIVIVGLTVLQLGQGIVQRIRFRQIADSSCMAAAAAYSFQSLPLEQVNLTHEYILLAHHAGEALTHLNEAALLVQAMDSGHDELSAFFSSASFISTLAPYEGQLSSICTDPHDPGIIPEAFFEEFQSLAFRNATIAGQQVRQANCRSFNSPFEEMEQIIVPDTFLWREIYPQVELRGFFQVSNMPSPRFFFLNAFPYAEINRRGRMITATYVPLASINPSENNPEESLKDRFLQAISSLESINQSNVNRISQMNLLDIEDNPDDLTLLSELWEAIILDFQLWAESSLELALFSHTLDAASEVRVPVLSSLISVEHGQAEALIQLAEQKGINVSDLLLMEQSLSSLINMEVFFSEPSLELSVASFHQQILTYFEDLETDLSLSKEEFEDMLALLKNFNINHNPLDIDLPTILTSIAQDMQEELDEPSMLKIQPFNSFLIEFSAGIQELYNKMVLTVQLWPDEDETMILVPSNAFFDQALDYFTIPLTRLESH